MTRTVFRACTLCEALCGLRIDIEGDAVVSIAGDRDDPFSRGHICPKAVALQDLHADPDRLRHPVRRTPTGWERIGWDEAIEETAARLVAVQREYGRDAVGSYHGNPTSHNYGSALFGYVLLEALGSRNRFSATSVDQLPHHLAAYFMFGHQLLLPIPDIDRTDFMLILGANPVVSNGSLMTAPGVANRLKALRDRGGKLVVVDPRRTETAALADRHLFVRPGTDVFLLLALLETIFTEKLEKPGRLEAFTDGIAELRWQVADFPPEAVADITGIDAATIRTLARDFAAAGSAVCYARLGACTQEFGAATIWLANALNIVTGNFDRAGGAMFTRPAVDTVAIGTLLGLGGHWDRWRSRVRGLPEFAGELPVAVLGEEILTPGPGQIRALVTSAGNPVLSTPNGGKLDEALAGLDFMVSIDFFINETTRHAHIILPPTAALEHENYDLVFHWLAVRNTAKFSPAVFEPAPDARHDWEILLDLATRIETKRFSPIAPLRRMAARAVGGPLGVIDLGLRLGPYGDKFNPFSKGLNLKRLRESVHGIDLGPLEPCLPDRLFTKSHRIAVAPSVLTADLERVRGRLRESRDGAELVLIGRRHLRSNNSWLHNSDRLVRGKDRCTVLVHPTDAARLGIVGGQVVRIESRVGMVEAAAEISDEVMPGVVSLPHGWGHARPGVRLAVAGRRPGVSANDLTDDRHLDELSGTAALNGVFVRIVPPAGLIR